MRHPPKRKLLFKRPPAVKGVSSRFCEMQLSEKPVTKIYNMSNSKFNQSYRSLAKKWGTTSTTVRRYAEKGCDWNASDYDVAVWLLKRGKKKPPAMYDAIYAVPGISDVHKPQRSTPLSQSIDYHAFGKLITLSCELEAQVAELKEGDTESAIRLQAEVNKLDAMIAKLEGENRHL